MQPSPTGYLSPVPAEVLDIAGIELARHVNDDGTCRECEDAWPCEPACLAVFTLGGGLSS